MGLANTITNRLISIFILAIFVGSAVQAQTLTKQQQDSAYLVNPSQERI